MEQLEMKKLYKVVIKDCRVTGLRFSNIFTDFLMDIPKPYTEHEPGVVVHTAYFVDPLEAEEYKEDVCKKVLLP